VAASLVNDPFGSHVLRSLLILLVPDLPLPNLHDKQKQDMRSKRSANYKAKAGPMTSIFEGSQTLDTRKAPKSFMKNSKQILLSIRHTMTANEVRAAAADKVACPTLRVCIIPLFGYTKFLKPINNL
jgi:nucleolar protein 9